MLARLLLYLFTLPWRALRRRRAEAWHRKGRHRVAAGDAAGGRLAFERALSIRPERREWWIDLGDLRLREGDFAKAVMCYRAAVEGDEAVPELQLRLGRALLASGDVFEAIGVLRAAYTKAPTEEALSELVHALIQSDNVRKARSVAEQAASANPGSFAARLVLAMVCQKAHDPAEALRHYEEALRLRPGDPEALDMRGATYQQLGRMDEALADYERALQAAPQHAPARFHRGLARLLLGDFEGGWEGYELRKLSEDTTRAPELAPEWDGAPLDGTLLVRREQGLGDEIMFASIYREVIARARSCVIECEPRLRRLFSRSFPQATFFPALPDRTLPARLAEQKADRQIDAGSLAKLFRRGAGSFPRHEGYLKADPARVERWKGRLAALGDGPKVGISWTGGVRKTGRGLRSLTLDAWMPLLEEPAHFVSLQYTPDAEGQVEEVRRQRGVSLHHWADAIEDYDETAALVCALDLVVSVCTSVVHLCGSLNRPVWVLAPYSPEWRYGFRGESMPWYPSVRIFRQQRFGDWSGVLPAVVDEVRHRFPAVTPAGR